MARKEGRSEGSQRCSEAAAAAEQVGEGPTSARCSGLCLEEEEEEAEQEQEEVRAVLVI